MFTYKNVLPVYKYIYISEGKQKGIQINELHSRVSVPIELFSNENKQ